MRVAIIGRSETLFDVVLALMSEGHEITVIVTAAAAPEYSKTHADFKDLAESLGIPFFHTTKPKTIIRDLELSSSDICVSMNFPAILSERVIDTFGLGVLNIHGGDLPRYRGNACQAWALINGETEIGLCVHKMIGGQLDDGDIIARSSFQVSHETKIKSVLDSISKTAPGLILEALTKLESNPHFFLEKQSVDPSEILRCYPRRPSDGNINWNLEPIEVIRLINASGDPYEGAFSALEGSKVVIHDAELVNDGEQFLAVPGQITKKGEKSIEVACMGGKIRILSMSLNGDLIIPAEAITSLRQRFN